MEAFVRALLDDRPAVRVPWEGLARYIRPVPGTLVIALGAPGACKSLSALVWGVELAKVGDPVRLISLDTDPLTQGLRVVANLTGHRVDHLAQEPKAWASMLRKQRLPVRVIDTPISPEDVDEILQADTEYFGKPPAICVVDDMRQVVRSPDYTTFEVGFNAIHRAARRNHTVVLALHHVHRGDSAAGKEPIHLSDGKYGGEYEAEIVLGLWRPIPTTLRVGILKNRFGLADPGGEVYVDLEVDPARVQLGDFKKQGQQEIA